MPAGRAERAAACGCRLHARSSASARPQPTFMFRPSTIGVAVAPALGLDWRRLPPDTICGTGAAAQVRARSGVVR